MERELVLPEHRVVVISTAHGLKFTGFKVGYHDGVLPDVSSRYANPPLELPADYATVCAALSKAIGGVIG